MPHSHDALPSLRNGPLALIVAAINLLCAFCFQYGREPVSSTELVRDGAVCGVITGLTSVFLVAGVIQRLRKRGALPSRVPRAAWLRYLPCRPGGLAVVFALIFGPLTAGVCWLVPAYFGVSAVGFAGFVLWKIIYALALAQLVVECAILRLVQPDCDAPSAPPRGGTQDVRNPLPGRERLAHLYAAVTTDFGLNLIVGLLFGGVLVREGSIVILPTASAGLIFTGPILGAIVAVLFVLPVARTVWQRAGEGGSVPPRRWHRFLPATPARFTWMLTLPVMVAATLAFMLVFAVFRFESLDFFQFFFVRAAFMAQLTAPVTALAVFCRRRLPAAPQNERHARSAA